MKKHTARGLEGHAGAGRRLTPRVPAAEDCVLRWADGAAEGSLLDLSIGGAAVSVATGLELPAGPEVTLELPDVSVPAEIVAEDDDSFVALVVRLRFEADLGEIHDLVAECEREFRARQVSIFRGHA
jgi:hypothetical protein